MSVSSSSASLSSQLSYNSTSNNSLSQTKNSSSVSFTVNVDRNDSFSSSTNTIKTASLQESFKNYRDYKMDGIRLNEANKLLRKGYRSNPERMSKLRLKFVEQAKKYFNVPYAKKYFSPDSPEYQSKLFLDCCGLVRRVMRDLEQDFGFRIGGGNQAYMFDTLPKTIEKLEDVKPGDLVFIKAIYYNPKMKKQPHNITHVEIMLGEGEKTIGARWNNGKIQVFDSYKFVSKSYHSQEYFIKSIDPWLLGVCRSYCLKHPWRYNTAIRNKKSIFSLESDKKTKKINSIKDISSKKKIRRKKKKRSKSKTLIKSQKISNEGNNNSSLENAIIKANIIKELEDELNLSEESDYDYDYDDDDDDDNTGSEQDENCEEYTEDDDVNSSEYYPNPYMNNIEQDDPAEEVQNNRVEFCDDFSSCLDYNKNSTNNNNQKRPFTCINRGFKTLSLNN